MQPYIIIIKPYLLPGKRIYGAFVPDIPGCAVTGKTLEQTLDLIRASLRTALVGMVEAGKEIPQPTEFAKWEQDYRESVEALEPEDILVALVGADMASIKALISETDAKLPNETIITLSPLSNPIP
jgi:predicted RNase H-like HicB family nuclease